MLEVKKASLRTPGQPIANLLGTRVEAHLKHMISEMIILAYLCCLSDLGTCGLRIVWTQRSVTKNDGKMFS